MRHWHWGVGVWWVEGEELSGGPSALAHLSVCVYGGGRYEGVHAEEEGF